MKVLRHGTTPLPVVNHTYRCYCGGCKAWLEYETKDLKRMFKTGTPFLKGPPFIFCPVCGQRMFQNFIQRWWNRVVEYQ